MEGVGSSVDAPDVQERRRNAPHTDDACFAAQGKEENDVREFKQISFWKERSRLAPIQAVNLGLALFLALMVLDGLTRVPLEAMARVGDQFPQVDRIVITTPAGETAVLEDEETVARYRDLMEPGMVFSGSQREIRAAVVEKVAEVTFYIGDRVLVREELYLLQAPLEESLRRCVWETERGPLIGKVGRYFRSSG